jgi:hypothetical protein
LGIHEEGTEQGIKKETEPDISHFGGWGGGPVKINNNNNCPCMYCNIIRQQQIVLVCTVNIITVIAI